MGSLMGGGMGSGMGGISAGAGGSGIDIALHAQNDPNFARSLERGSRLVACVPGAERVVMQLPRGNLYACEWGKKARGGRDRDRE